MIVIISQLRCCLTFAGQSFNILIVLRASGLLIDLLFKKNILIDLLLQSYNKQVAGFK